MYTIKSINNFIQPRVVNFHFLANVRASLLFFSESDYLVYARDLDRTYM